MIQQYGSTNVTDHITNGIDAVNKLTNIFTGKKDSTNESEDVIEVEDIKSGINSIWKNWFD